MNRLALSAALFALSLCAAPAQAAWGDVSYDPAPALIDEDRAAQFDAFGLLTHVVATAGGGSKYIQNFESGFNVGQRIDDWVALGGTRVRFGAGSNLQSIQWQATIGGIDPYASEFGMTHPHGTYGNAPGITGQPRNYIADLHFLSFPASTAPTYIVMQFEQPISSLGFSMADYAAGTGGNANISLWNGRSLDSLTSLPLSNGQSGDHSFAPGQISGDISYWFASGNHLPGSSNKLPLFNFAILRLDTQDSSVGLDNFVVGVSPVPEAHSYSMMAGGLMLLSLALRRRKLHMHRDS